MAYLEGVKILGTIHDGNICYFSIYKQVHSFLRFKKGSKMMVSGLTQLLGRVKSSDLVQSGPDTSPDVVERSMSGASR